VSWSKCASRSEYSWQCDFQPHTVRAESASVSSLGGERVGGWGRSLPRNRPRHASVPEGLADNNPTFQRWGFKFGVAQVPQGRLNAGHSIHPKPGGAPPKDDISGRVSDLAPETRHCLRRAVFVGVKVSRPCGNASVNENIKCPFAAPCGMPIAQDGSVRRRRSH
jgi:hypothetical protein